MDWLLKMNNYFFLKEIYAIKVCISLIIILSLTSCGAVYDIKRNENAIIYDIKNISQANLLGEVKKRMEFDGYTVKVQKKDNSLVVFELDFDSNSNGFFGAPYKEVVYNFEKTKNGIRVFAEILHYSATGRAIRGINSLDSSRVDKINNFLNGLLINYSSDLSKNETLKYTSIIDFLKNSPTINRLELLHGRGGMTREYSDFKYNVKHFEHFIPFSSSIFDVQLNSILRLRNDLKSFCKVYGGEFIDVKNPRHKERSQSGNRDDLVVLDKAINSNAFGEKHCYKGKKLLWNVWLMNTSVVREYSQFEKYKMNKKMRERLKKENLESIKYDMSEITSRVVGIVEQVLVF